MRESAPGKDPVSEKWRLVQATNAEAGKYLYLLSRKEESSFEP